jgi:hypothetical protein
MMKIDELRAEDHLMIVAEEFTMAATVLDGKVDEDGVEYAAVEYVYSVSEAGGRPADAGTLRMTIIVAYYDTEKMEGLDRARQALALISSLAVISDWENVVRPMIVDAVGIDEDEDDGGEG